MTLHYAVKKLPSSATVTLSGSLEDDASKALSELLPRLTKLDVTFDCERLAVINSRGFRAWILFLKSLEQVSTFNLASCPPVFVEYTTLLANTAFANRIVSVLVPFRCDECRKEALHLFEVDAMAPGEEFEERICPGCNGMSIAIQDAKDYFFFRELGSTEEP